MSQVNCGSLTYTEKPGEDGIIYRGPVTLGSRLDGTLALTKTSRARNDQAPDYEVWYRARGGTTTLRSIGSAWIKNHPNIGDFLTLTVDDPDWPSALNLAAFPPDNTGQPWRITWSRPRRPAQQEAA